MASTLKGISGLLVEEIRVRRFIKDISETGELAQSAEGLSSAPRASIRWLTNTCNSWSRGSDALFWSPQALALTRALHFIKNTYFNIGLSMRVRRKTQPRVRMELLLRVLAVTISGFWRLFGISWLSGHLGTPLFYLFPSLIAEITGLPWEALHECIIW